MSAGEIDDPTLLGYLLGGLDDAESERVEASLRTSQPLRDRLDNLRSRLAVSSPADDVGLEPPPGLADRTLAAVRSGSLASEQKRLERDRLRPIGLAPAAGSRLTVSKFNSSSYWFELSALAAAALIFGVIGLSHLLSLQESARRQRCAVNLATLGLAIQDFAFHRRDQSAPPIAPEGPLAFAGVYAVHLNDSELLGSPADLWCPSDPQSAASFWRCGGLPSTLQLREAGEEQLAIWRQQAGGSYAFNLGVQIDDHYQSSRYLSRAGFAVLGDAPVIRNGRFEWDAHGDNLCNVLFEDCRVQLLRRVGLTSTIDDPYLNDARLMQAGLHADDAAMGPSPLRPRADTRVLRVKLVR